MYQYKKNTINLNTSAASINQKYLFQVKRDYVKINSMKTILLCKYYIYLHSLVNIINTHLHDYMTCVNKLVCVFYWLATNSSTSTLHFIYLYNKYFLARVIAFYHFEAFLVHIGPKKNQLSYIFMKKENEFNCFLATKLFLIAYSIRIS